MDAGLPQPVLDDIDFGSTNSLVFGPLFYHPPQSLIWLENKRPDDADVLQNHLAWSCHKKGFRDFMPTIEPASADEPSSTDSPEHSSSHPVGIKSLLDAIPAAIPSLKYLSKSINFQKASCSLCFGLYDPVQTAVMSGYLWSLAAATGHLRTSIHIEPCFEEQLLEGDITFELGVRMLWPSVALINALREKKIRELLIMIIRERR